MSTQYDRLGRDFGEVETLSIRRYVELFRSALKRW